MSAIVPIPKIPITVRPATMDDLPFMDGLQKIHTKMVGWMPEKALIGKIKLGHVLIAEERHEGTEAQRHEGVIEAQVNGVNSLSPSLPGPHSVPRCLVTSRSPRTMPSVPVGYAIGNDQYFKRDDVGIIYQMNVVPGKQRGFVGATLLKAMFDRAAYGCKLFCCWCAQDIEANRFWESTGFVPLAFRAGSQAKSRVHIFWQRRIRAGDETTPYWFPSQTSSGSLREDRLVLPIPPGTHWSDAKPMVLPTEESTTSQATNLNQIQPPARGFPESKMRNMTKPACSALPGLRFTMSGSSKKQQHVAPRQKLKNDPKLVAAARELRDRWLEQVNRDPAALVSQAKYEVARAIVNETMRHLLTEPQIVLPAFPALPAAA